MQLSRQNINKISSAAGLVLPEEKLFSLPERVLQFGTGVLLRGLPDYFIDKANRKGIFNGRVVVVKSTATGGSDAFAKQDCLYTICVRGLKDGQPVEENIINSSISRVLSANEEWATILECARNPEIQIIISNTTEVGIALVEDNIHGNPPISFPGKLLAFLFERYKSFGGSMESGMIIIPTELITDNAGKLLSIVKELARQNNLEGGFVEWLIASNHFCNSLVDRIVPGKLNDEQAEDFQKNFGYDDDLAIMTESFNLWAIEFKNERARDILSFSQANKGVVMTDDIEKFRELKLRLLNGTHSFNCGLAFLAGFKTVREAMQDKLFSSFAERLMKEEIVTAITGNIISEQEAMEYSNNVLDRFRNPFLDHQWINIAVQYSSKMKLRNIPLLYHYAEKTGRVPEFMTVGFAGWILFMKCCEQNGRFVGRLDVSEYTIQDDKAAWFAAAWKEYDQVGMVDAVWNSHELWGKPLPDFDEFRSLVKKYIDILDHNGVMETLRELTMSKIIAR